MAFRDIFKISDERREQIKALEPQRQSNDFELGIAVGIIASAAVAFGVSEIMRDDNPDQACNSASISQAQNVEIIC